MRYDGLRECDGGGVGAWWFLCGALCIMRGLLQLAVGNRARRQMAHKRGRGDEQICARRFCNTWFGVLCVMGFRLNN